ncbi:glutathione S-transferase family protein [Sorangium cellulosum]|uniref:Glutathione S-transferase n=1 Tax=Sorangium cellulosum So0157-2 TaxID=1254432 RepID=S4XVD8_SORCE|nr:glutathione S-transferase family protein [Sorangium cellulosum]AGP34558.1 glutathione S-transferase [Sorangium cellulosum So0157-2]
MILIGQYDSPFVRRVAVALQHYGLAYEHRPWSVWADAESIAKYNPLRRVPVLVTDSGESLVESAAILDALDDLVGPDRALLPRSGEARRAGLRVCALATGLADKAVSLLYEHVLRQSDRRSQVWVDRCAAQLGETLDVLERERERAARGGDFWFGAFSHADIAVGCALRFIGEAHPSVTDAARRPALAAHAARCEALPAFAAVVQPLHVAVKAS